jgi:hypothetical protein
MNRKFASLVSLAFISTLTGCSYSTDFVVLNKSNDAITVTYSFISDRAIQEDKIRKKPIKEVENRESDWLHPPQDQYTLDLKSNSVTVELAPQEALLLDQMGNYDEDDAKYFRIASVTIKGSNGSEAYEGKLVLKQFERESMLLYTKTYE